MGLLLSVILIAIALGFFAAPLWAWFVALGVFLLGCDASHLWWIPVIALAVVFLIKKVRVQLITKPLFAMLKAKGLLPKISDTEKTALRAGDVWVEGELFSGKPDFQKIFAKNLRIKLI